MLKTGHPADRYACAIFALEQRARFRAGEIKGHDYRAWTRQVFIATRNKLAILTQRRREADKVVPFCAIQRKAQAECRAIVRDPFAGSDRAALIRQIEAEHRNEWRAA